MSADAYQNPLTTRYSSPEMAEIFGSKRRARIWRQLWLALAEYGRGAMALYYERDGRYRRTIFRIVEGG